MDERIYQVKALCPHCGREEMLAVTASDRLALPQGEAPKALAHCPECGADFDAPVNRDTCAEWDDFCKEVHPVPQV